MKNMPTIKEQTGQQNRCRLSELRKKDTDLDHTNEKKV
jgi:hypothetical protein